MIFKKYLFEVALSLGLVVVAVTISNLNPLAAGLFAALPIRVGTSLFLIGRVQGEEALREAVLGSIYGVIGVAIFTGSLYLFLGKYPSNSSFAMSSAITLVYAAIILAGRKYGLL